MLIHADFNGLQNGFKVIDSFGISTKGCQVFLFDQEKQMLGHLNFSVGNQLTVSTGVVPDQHRISNYITWLLENKSDWRLKVPQGILPISELSEEMTPHIALSLFQNIIGLVALPAMRSALINTERNVQSNVRMLLELTLNQYLQCLHIGKLEHTIFSAQAQTDRFRQLLEENVNAGGDEYDAVKPESATVKYGQAMQRIEDLIAQVAFTNSTVLILGETGTGKELAAKAIHRASPRSKEVMVKVNCAALPLGLIESELFGHERGSFTGAVNRHIGKFELAENGTLFLDEIGEIPLQVQAKLLRAIQEREIERIGGNNAVKVNVRIIAASNRNLHNEMVEGRFRADLFYRLNVFPILLPSLRERKEDIGLLANQFVKQFARAAGKKVQRIADRAIQQMMNYDWPGNVRELEHFMERTVLVTKEQVIRSVELPSAGNRSFTEESETFKTMEENEREHILSALRLAKGKIYGKGGAADLLGMNFNTLNSRIRKLDIRKTVVASVTVPK